MFSKSQLTTGHVLESRLNHCPIGRLIDSTNDLAFIVFISLETSSYGILQLTKYFMNGNVAWKISGEISDTPLISEIFLQAKYEN